MGVYSSIEINSKQLERVLDNNLAYKDFLRQGLINPSQLTCSQTGRACHNSTMEDASLDLDAEMSSPFRICTLNVNFQLCKSLPSLLIVPRDTSDECIRKNVKCHRQGRLPIIVWRHAGNRAVLLRSSGFHGKSFIGMLMKSGQAAASKTFLSIIE
jgi:hypothetical protein